MKENVCLFRLMAGHNFCRLHVHLFTNDEFGELNQLYEEVYLRVLFGDAFRIEFLASKKPSAKTGRTIRSGEDIMKVPERRL